MIATETEYVPAYDDPAISMRELANMLADVRGMPDVRRARAYLKAMIVDGLGPSDAWKAAGLPGRFDPDASPVKRVFAGRPRGLFDR